MNSCFWYAKNYLYVYKVWLGTMLNQDLTFLETILARSIWLHLQHTYVNTSIPHPAMAVKSLGPRSLAGFMAQPLFIPKEQVRTIIRSPIAIGSRPLGTLLFLVSKIANIARRRTAVDITWPRQRKEYWINKYRFFPIMKRGAMAALWIGVA